MPPDAEPSVRRQLIDLGAQLVVCERGDPIGGDPCYRRFLEAVAAGALPFGCQGPDNGLSIDGAQTVGYELATALHARGASLDVLVVQVGGGALASACLQALECAVELRLLPTLPRVYAVQTAAVAPLERAYEQVARAIAERLGNQQLNADQRAAHIATNFDHPCIDEVLRHAAGNRGAFMWPWERTPASLARGIIDDETYDWHAVVRGMLRSGGRPVTVDEPTLGEAHRLAAAMTTYAASPTGTAGLAGLIELTRSGACRPTESAAVLCTGAARDPLLGAARCC